jgi:hypothetical protein
LYFEPAKYKVMGLTPKYTKSDVSRYISLVLLETQRRIVEVMKQDGKTFVDSAKAMTAEQGSFKNHTFDLLSSIGYYIFAGNTLVDSYFSGNAAGKEAADEAVKSIPRINGYQLIGIAGMFYAIYVESKGYNVISTQTNMAFVNIITHLSQVAKAR